MAAWPKALLCLCLCVFAAGCRSYSEKLEPVRHAAASGDPQSGLERIDRMLKLSSPLELPERWDAEVPLVMLERATLLQAVGDYKASERNFQATEQELEFLDLSKDVPGKVSEYILSASAKKYRSTPIEKLFLNSLNMVNYLALGDLQGARVEARRWRIMRDYLRDYAKGESLGTGSAYGAFLAGYAFEQSGKPEQALRYYADALVHADMPFLAPWLVSLGQQSAYRSPELQAAMQGSAALAPDQDSAEILVLAQVGQVPYRQAKRVPVGLAAGMAAHFFVGSPDLLERGATKFVNYPELVVESPGPSGATLAVSGERQALTLVASASLAVQHEFDRLRPQIVAAALSRTLGRAAIGYGIESGTNAAQGDGKGGGALGFLLGAAVEASLVAADKPDTRSWSVLPGYYFVTRMRVAPGDHEVELQLAPSQTSYAQRIKLRAGEKRVLLFSAYLE